MNKYIPADKLIAEIESRMEDCKLPDGTFPTKTSVVRYEELSCLRNLIASVQQEQPELPGYDKALLEVKRMVDKLYDEASIGLSEYDSGLYNGIAETCMKLRGFIKARLDSDEQPELPGIEDPGIPGKDFIPVEWVDACEMYGKWKIVKQDQPEADLDKEIVNEWTKCRPIDEGMGAEYANISVEQFDSLARHFYGLRNRALEEAARLVYESWMGGTMDDVRLDMVALGKVLNARKE